MDLQYLSSAVEAIILASPEPIPARKVAAVLDEVTPAQIGQAVAELNERYRTANASFRVREIAGGFQYYIMPEYVGYVEELFARRRKLRLTRPALETVAIIAYKQPVTKAEIEHIRGVASDGVIHNLLEKNMITITGRSETVGKPLQYGTTDEFLKFFGLNRLSDLPKMTEIEELVTAAEQRNQTELILQESADGEVKFNIADGSFDPDSREEVRTESREGLGEPGPRLILRKTGEDTEDDFVSTTQEEADGDAELPQESESTSDPVAVDAEFSDDEDTRS
jgi:segregation and condensation protein B